MGDAYHWVVWKLLKILGSKDKVAIRSGVKVTPDWDTATVFTEGTGCIGRDLVVEGASCFVGYNDSLRDTLK